MPLWLNKRVNLFDLSGQTAVVLGGTGVLGGALASALCEAGANVAILGRNRERGEARAEELRAGSSHAAFVSADAMSRESLETARDTIYERFGEVQILVNAAGGNVPGATLQPGARVEELQLDAWSQAFDLNLIGGALLPCQVWGAEMCARKRGSIINVASLSGMTPLSRVVAYSAAKAAVLNLTQFLAREWAPFGVRVNALSPGFFPAQQNRRLLFNDDNTPTERGAQILNHTPMARFGDAPELAGAVVFLASQRASSFVTGHNLVVDGGFSSQTI